MLFFVQEVNKSCWVHPINLLHKTRKSSCVNARGIPTATYQVLHLLGVPPPLSDMAGVPPLPSDLNGVPPCLDLAGVPPIRPGWGTPPPSGPGWGTPPHLDLAEVPPPRPGWGAPPYLDLTGVPPCQTWLGYPPSLPIWTWLGSPPRGVHKLTNWNYYLPLILRILSVKRRISPPISRLAKLS